MARSKLTDTPVQLMEKEGAVLFSLVKGEQREFPVELDFVLDVTAGYVFEAVVVEAENVTDQTEAPTTLKSSGAQVVINVRIPVYTGLWFTATEYTLEQVVMHEGIYYKLMTETLTDSISPPNNDNWVVTNLATVYLQFMSTLSSTWAQSPQVSSPSYGFFELRVTEPANAVMTETWKPVRGMVEILFSPTDIVADP